jgi:hypothetical protein
MKIVIHAEVATASDIAELIATWLAMAQPLEVELFEAYVSGLVDTRNVLKKPDEPQGMEATS